jgi:hypothetical protein
MSNGLRNLTHPCYFSQEVYDDIIKNMAKEIADYKDADVARTIKTTSENTMIQCPNCIYYKDEDHRAPCTATGAYYNGCSHGTRETMAKLNKKKTTAQVMTNLTDETRAKFSVRPNAEGKVYIYDKVKKKFTMRDVRS